MKVAASRGAEDQRRRDAEPWTHDYFQFWKWIYATACYAQSRHPLYVAYIVFFILYLLYMISASLYAAYLTSSNKEFMLRAFHTTLIALFALFVIVNRLFISATLERMRLTLVSGIFAYPEGDLDAEERRMLEGIIPEIRFKSNAWFSMMLAGGVTNMIFFPISQLFLVSDSELSETPYFVNPYLPNFFWSPYNRTVPGYCLMYLLNFSVLYYTYIIASCQNMIYLSWNVQFRTHFQVLDHSIGRAEERALRLYGERFGSSRLGREDILRCPEYQDCLYSCLMENVRHHQALLRLKEESTPFIGALLFIIVTSVSLFYANLFYLILQKPRINFAINYIATFLVENTYTFYQCVFGQDIQDHSGGLFESLYNTPWYRFNKKCKQLLHIMMCNSRRPIQLKAYFFEFTANFQTYAERFSLMYSIINVLR